MRPDPARATLERAVTESAEHVDRAAQAALRAVCAGRPWQSPEVSRARDQLRQALLDHAAAKLLLAALNDLDAEGVS